jgi:hypothetical protein
MVMKVVGFVVACGGDLLVVGLLGCLGLGVGLVLWLIVAEVMMDEMESLKMEEWEDG